MTEDTHQQKKKAIEFFLDKEILLSADMVELLQQEGEAEKVYSTLSGKASPAQMLVLYPDLKDALSKGGKVDINWVKLEEAKALAERGKNPKLYSRFIDYLKEDISAIKKPNPVEVIYSFEEDSRKREVQDFIDYFNARYRGLSQILGSRQELANATAIGRVLQKRERESISIIGMVSEKSVTKNGNLVLSLEDPSGIIKVIVNKNKPELFALCQTVVLDEVIGVIGFNGDKVVFATNILWPDIPRKEIKKSGDDLYVLFLSDLHVGSNKFLLDGFEKFLRWLNLEEGSEKQREIATKVRYLIIAGDLVDGCNIYPEQDKELLIKDVSEQYKECARLLSKIPRHISVILCPGNHDAMRVAEPQPPLYKDFAEEMYKIPNITFVSNPALVRIHASETFSGFDLLLYHGYSFDYFVANVDDIRNHGGYNRADIIMSFLLKRRHLSPSHTSTLYVPFRDIDPLLISHVPDFFITGHIHKSAVAHYKNVTTICGSCWQAKTAFQEKVGHNPEPGRVPAVNLKTREVKVLKFI